MKHDSIVDSGGADHSLVEGEASKVASQAVKALAQSRKRCYNAYSGVPTWTGKHGGNETAPRFGGRTKKKQTLFHTKNNKNNNEKDKNNKLFAGKDLFSNGNNAKESDGPLFSGDLLSAIKKRNISSFDLSDDEVASSSDVVVPPPQLCKSKSAPCLENGSRYDGILKELRHFIAFGAKVDGRAGTNEILSRFGNRVALQDSAVFKSLLQKICDFNRSSEGEGVWILKMEFR